MHNNFLSFFEKEISFLKKDVAQFSRKYPELAKKLNVHGSSIEDPDISRLIESVALLNARVHQKMEDDYPNLVRQLIRMLFPQVVCPLPSYSIMEFKVSEKSSAVERVPEGSLFTVKDDGVETHFSTCADLDLFPIDLYKVEIFEAPFNLYKPDKAVFSQSLLKVSFRSQDGETLISNIIGDELVFYLDGELQDSYRLYDIIFSELDCMVLSVGKLEDGIELGCECVQPYSIEKEINILPYPVQGFGALSAINEFFNYTDKLRFISIDISSFKHKLGNANEMSLYMYFKNIPLALSRTITKDSFKLNCVPVVNLYPLEAEPLRVSGNKMKNTVITDVTNSYVHTFSIDEIKDISTGKGNKVTALYEDKYYDVESDLHYLFEQNISVSGEFKTHVTLVGSSKKNILDKERVFSVKVKAMMTDKVSLLSSQSDVNCLSALTLNYQPRMLKKPSSSLMNVLNDNVSWDLIQHLNLNLSVIFSSCSPVIELKNILSIYNRNDKAKNESWINSIVSLKMERVVSPARISNKSCYVQGSRIEMELNKSELNTGGLFIFIHTLDYFFSWFCGFNSFTQLDIRLDGVSGIYYSCPRRMGWRAGC
ncbi:type VI secretion system baseplate subunit TssF [uncultured Shewanella sp.]|uniref:type VI secretion system baseplate subunit TssF n=1 Tax=uncultured Shewanella sp. TaxID=173975 RepID=UPI002611373E|nr:type VI secretion system baseplate subunit TssF [uncultured Shewanella sp.]